MPALYGGDMQQIVVSATLVDAKGEAKQLTAEEIGFSYRHTEVPEDWIFVETVLRGHAGDSAEIAAKMAAIRAAREDSQPLRTRTGGSTFANPPDISAWKLVDEAGCRGLKVGGAQVSEKHCNFLLNLGDATAADIETLGEEVRARVKATSGVDLRWEIRRIGEAS